MLDKFLDMSKGVQNTVLFIFFFIGFLIAFNYGLVLSLIPLLFYTYLNFKIKGKAGIIESIMMIGMLFVIYSLIFSLGDKYRFSYWERILIVFAWIGMIPTFIFLKLGGQAYLDKETIPDDLKEKVNTIEVFSTSDIGKQYKPLKLIQSSGITPEEGLFKLKEQALSLDADAIVNLNMSMGQNTSGRIKADTFITPGGGGDISTENTFYYIGDAVKLI